MSDQNTPDARLWAKLRHTSPVPETEPPELMAAYLEGRLDETEAAQVEAWLAADPLARAMLLETDSMAETEGPSEAAIRQAQQLVHPQRSKFAWFGMGRRLPNPALFGTACALFVAFFTALELGASTHSVILEMDDRIAAAIWIADTPARKPS